jgi:hypothetical protein
MIAGNVLEPSVARASRIDLTEVYRSQADGKFAPANEASPCEIPHGYDVRGRRHDAAEFFRT